MLKKITVLLLSLFFTIPGAAVANAAQSINYVAFGDSIAAHFGLEEDQGYAELLAAKLAGEGGYSAVFFENFAQSGDDTQDLLLKIENNKSRIAEADVVTVCIGGNNFLGTIVAGMLSSVGLTGQTMYTQGANLMRMEFSDDMYRLAAKGLESPEIQAALAKGIARFRADLPVIVSNISEIAPNAQIYIMTVYNPLEQEHPIHPYLDPIETQINAMIKDAKGVTIVDVYAAYESFPNKPQLSLGGIDPHPSVDGQRLIANEHYRAITGKESGDIVEVNRTGGEVIHMTEPAIETMTIPESIATQATASNAESTPEPELDMSPAPTIDTENSNYNIVWIIAISVMVLAAGGLFYLFRRRR